MIASGNWKRRGKFALLTLLVGVGACHLGSNKKTDLKPVSKPAVTGNKGLTFVWAPVQAIAQEPRSIVETFAALSGMWLLRRHRRVTATLHRCTDTIDECDDCAARIRTKLEPDAVERELRRIVKKYPKRRSGKGLSACSQTHD